MPTVWLLPLVLGAVAAGLAAYGARTLRRRTEAVRLAAAAARAVRPLARAAGRHSAR